jgi:hypothetical protein
VMNLRVLPPRVWLICWLVSYIVSQSVSHWVSFV